MMTCPSLVWMSAVLKCMQPPVDISNLLIENLCFMTSSLSRGKTHDLLNFSFICGIIVIVYTENKLQVLV